MQEIHDNFLRKELYIHVNSYEEVSEIVNYYRGTQLDVGCEVSITRSNWNTYPFIFSEYGAIHGHRYGNGSENIEFSEWLEYVQPEELEESEAEVSYLFM